MELQQFTEKEKKHLIKIGLENILIHWASNTDLAKDPKIFIAGEGCYIYDIHGNKYLDTFSSLITTICGHNRPEMKQAAMDQMNHLAFFPNYHDTFTIPVIKLAEKLAEIMPGDLEVSFFVNSGSEANETAIKMVKQYHWQNGQSHRYKVIARKYSYHGTTLGAISYTGFPALREFCEPLIPGSLFAPPARCYECDLGLEFPSCDLACLKAMEKMIEWEHPESIAAIIMDPIPGSNSGYPLPPDGYLQGVRDLCNKYGILLIFDEVQTGFGKTGKWFACENWNVTPDIMTISKALTGGYAPLGVAVTTKKIADVFKKGPGTEFRSGGTYGGHPVSCAAALANIDIIEREKLVERAGESGKYLKAELEKLYKYKIVGSVRGIGMLWAVELMADRKTKTKLDAKLDVGTFVRDWCWENGMILRNNGDILVIAPALVMTREEMDIMLGQLNKVIPLAMKHFGL
jgi:adenosylmethionine-8-amino-7-oxononanoate aminotransferase